MDPTCRDHLKSHLQTYLSGEGGESFLERETSCRADRELVEDFFQCRKEAKPLQDCFIRLDKAVKRKEESRRHRGPIVVEASLGTATSVERFSPSVILEGGVGFAYYKGWFYMQTTTFVGVELPRGYVGVKGSFSLIPLAENTSLGGTLRYTNSSIFLKREIGQAPPNTLSFGLRISDNNQNVFVETLYTKTEPPVVTLNLGAKLVFPSWN